MTLTGVEEESINEGAVTEEGAHRCHIVKEAVPKGGVDEGDRLQFHVDESSKGHDSQHVSTGSMAGHMFMSNSKKRWISCFVLGVSVNID